jgi:hypothetical protein
MTVKEFFKRFTIGTIWNFKCVCTGKSNFGMVNGESYEQKMTVIKVKRIRRQWEDPGKEITFMVESANIGKGYSHLSTNDLKDAVIEDKGDFIRIVFQNNKKVLNDYYFVEDVFDE